MQRLATRSVLALALMLGCASAAFAQSPPTDPQSKTKKESPTTVGTGKTDQGMMPEGQKPATDPQSKAENESTSTMGMGKGDQKADPTKTSPPTDPQSKDAR